LIEKYKKGIKKMPKLLIPKTATDEFLILVKADVNQLEKLINLLNSAKATSPRSQGILSKIVDILEISVEDAYDVVMLVDFLSKQKEISNINDDEFISEIKGFIEKSDNEEALKNMANQTLRQALLNLFGKKPIAELAKKKEKLETGLLKTVVDIEGTCELRPVFNIERSHIVDKVVTVIARLTLEDDKDNEDSLIFQLNSKSLKKLKEFIEITEKKIEIMQKEITAVEPKK
jgi:hypothetical protein